MLIDTHCHIDQFTSPEMIVRECEASRIRVVAVTNLPSHFAIAADRLRGHPLVSPALGMHPLYVKEGVRELAAFKRMVPHADFIGEIGLDFSRHSDSINVQERVFEEVLSAITDRPRFITLHSRGAEKSVLEGLRRHDIHSAVFHWFTGSQNVLDEVLSDGHFLSINPAMLGSISGKRVITHAPRNRILVESDGPFAKISEKPCNPTDVSIVYQSLAGEWLLPIEDVCNLVKHNFERIVKPIAEFLNGRKTA